MSTREKLDAALEAAREADVLVSAARRTRLLARDASLDVYNAAHRAYHDAKDIANAAWSIADAAADEMVAVGLPDPRQEGGTP